MLYRNQYTIYPNSKLKNNEKNEPRSQANYYESPNNKEFKNNFNKDNYKTIQNNNPDHRLKTKDNKMGNFLSQLMYSTQEDLDKEIDKLINPNSSKNEEVKNKAITTRMNYLEHYNTNWEDEFRKEGLSLDDDGIYEYIDGDDKMAIEYYNGEIPKTKIKKENSTTRGGAEVRNNQQVITDELNHLKFESAIVQKAWISNNKRINDLIDIVESQERELKKFRGESPVSTSNEIDSLVQRIKKLEKNNDLGSSAEDRASLDKLRSENKKLKELLSKNSSMNVDDNGKLINKSFNNKKEQSYFYVINEHESPKIKKSEINTRKK